MTPSNVQPHVAIACGGTGGHLYPGLAVGDQLLQRGAAVTLVVSARELDQQAVRGEARFRVLTVPALPFSWRGILGCARGIWRSYRLALRSFQESPPVSALLSVGGFTSVPPAFAARRLGAPVFLHEANAVPGRANRWLARWARRGYVLFPEAAVRLRMRDVREVGMPVRRPFGSVEPGACRLALGLDPARPVLLVTGGSQGARGINEAVTRAAPALLSALPRLQILHLTGAADEPRVRAAYRAAGVRAVVRAFLTEMELALGAADAAVARAGASSSAELAALRVPALLVPYPHAADGHQMENARALERAGAVKVLPQAEAVPDRLAPELVALLTDEALRARLREAWAAWHRPDADAALAEDLLEGMLDPGQGRLPTGTRRASAPSASPA